MIDIEKMKALPNRLRKWNWINDPIPQEAATAIDTLLSELEAREADRRDAERLKVYATTDFTTSDALLHLELRFLNGEKRTLEAYREAIDQEILAQRQEGEDDDRPRNN